MSEWGGGTLTIYEMTSGTREETPRGPHEAWVAPESRRSGLDRGIERQLERSMHWRSTPRSVDGRIYKVSHESFNYNLLISKIIYKLTTDLYN